MDRDEKGEKRWTNGKDVENLEGLEGTVGSPETHGGAVSGDQGESDGLGEADDGNLVWRGGLVGDSLVSGDGSDLKGWKRKLVSMDRRSVRLARGRTL